MFYYVVLYSFDHSRPVFGPFNDEDSCWIAMETDAEKEYVDDIENNVGKCVLDKIRVAGTIKLSNIFENNDPDTTLWAIIEIPDTEEDKN